MEPLHHSSQGFNATDPSLELQESGIDAAMKEKYRRLFQSGLRWLGVGAFLMLASFGVNFLLFHSEQSFTTIMYVLTTLGTICMVKGVADVLGF